MNENATPALPTNPFQIIPWKIRLALYLGYGIWTLVLSCITLYLTSIGEGIPTWCIGAGAVTLQVGTAFGFIAGGNVSSIDDNYDAKHDREV